MPGAGATEGLLQHDRRQGVADRPARHLHEVAPGPAVDDVAAEAAQRSNRKGRPALAGTRGRIPPTSAQEASATSAVMGPLARISSSAAEGIARANNQP
jgi:hypothetical protein